MRATMQLSERRPVAVGEFVKENCEIGRFRHDARARHIRARKKYDAAAGEKLIASAQPCPAADGTLSVLPEP